MTGTGVDFLDFEDLKIVETKNATPIWDGIYIKSDLHVFKSLS